MSDHPEVVYLNGGKAHNVIGSPELLFRCDCDEPSLGKALTAAEQVTQRGRYPWHPETGWTLRKADRALKPDDGFYMLPIAEMQVGAETVVIYPGGVMAIVQADGEREVGRYAQ